MIVDFGFERGKEGKRKAACDKKHNDHLSWRLRFSTSGEMNFAVRCRRLLAIFRWISFPGLQGFPWFDSISWERGVKPQMNPDGRENGRGRVLTTEGMENTEGGEEAAEAGWVKSFLASLRDLCAFAVNSC